MSSGNQQEATNFSVKIRINEKEQFRPGMSVTAEIETRARTNALTVPFASVTTRVPKDKDKKNGVKSVAAADPPHTLTASAKTNSPPKPGSSPATDGTNIAKGDKKKEAKPIEVVFVVEGDHVKMVPVKIGISDDTHMEIIEGLSEGQEVVSAGYKAISRELEDGKKIKKGTVLAENDKEDGRKQAD